MCPISLMCLIFFAKNIGNNIKREETYSVRRAHVMKLCHFDFHVFFPRFMLFPAFFKTYKTHIKGIYELTTNVRLFGHLVIQFIDMLASHKV